MHFFSITISLPILPLPRCSGYALTYTQAPLDCVCMDLSEANPLENIYISI